MQDVELFLSMAEIAGVFVGFGALIAMRSGARVAAAEVMFVGMVVLIGVQAVAAALAPVAISRFAIGDHGLWVTCSVITLVVFWAGQEAHLHFSPERRAVLAVVPARVRGPWEALGALFWGPMTVALVVIILGVAPDLEAALYLAAVVLLLLLDAVMVLAVVTTGAPGWTPTVDARAQERS